MPTQKPSYVTLGSFTVMITTPASPRPGSATASPTALTTRTNLAKLEGFHGHLARLSSAAMWSFVNLVDVEPSAQEVVIRCPLNHIQCIGSKKCIHFNKLCNGARDCEDGYDEGVHCRELLSACHELRCRYGCVMTRNGTFCFCADGFEVGEDGTSCR
ncbi:hypothetical protein JOQ06_030027, partial [Pogonophryne albipinna]